MKTAIIFGSSGFVGSHLLRELLDSPDYGEVIAVVRKDGEMSHPKLKTLLGDYNSLRALGAAVSGDEIFICLGTTRKASPDEADYYRVDHDYPLLAAQLAKANGASSVFLVSAVGANPNSRFFYVKTKAETERDIARLGFEHAHFFRPSMITGQRVTRSVMETALIRVWSVINPLLLGRADRYRGMTGPEIARAMKNAAKHQSEKVKIYHWREMRDLLAV
jgi:uncharacterized protein YbjT (DUF2867 family)